MKLCKPVHRYFIFTRVNPKEIDYDRLDLVAGRINAFIGYRTLTATGSDSRKMMKGFVVLKGERTTVKKIIRFFPNFLLTAIPSTFEMDFSDLPGDTVFLGHHPLDCIRRRLFPDETLSDFMIDSTKPDEVEI